MKEGEVDSLVTFMVIKPFNAGYMLLGNHLCKVTNLLRFVN